jgi:predicted MFS family arabinose efflux permease
MTSPPVSNGHASQTGGGVTDSLRRRYVFFSVNYFVQGIIGIVYEPLNYLLKDTLRLTPGQASGFIAWMTLPLLLKPLYGFVTDFIPLGRYRRKPHLIIASLLAAIAYFGLAAQTHYRYFSLLFQMMLSIFAMGFADAVCGGLLVEDGKERHQTGPYQALHIGGLYLSAILVGTGGGWMTSHLPFRWIFGLASLMPLAIVAVAFFINEPERDQPRPRETGPLWAFIRTKPFWMLSLTIILWNFYPFLGTVQFYYQSNVLHLNPQWIGSLMTFGSVAGLLGSAAFWKFCRIRDTLSWISFGPIGMALVSLTYVFYRGALSVTVVEILFGFATVFFRSALFDLIARTCPPHVEATTYAIFLSFFDIAMYGSNAVGGKLYDFLQHALAAWPTHDQISAVVLILIGSLCTLACRWTLPIQGSEPLKESSIATA